MAGKAKGYPMGNQNPRKRGLGIERHNARMNNRRGNGRGGGGSKNNGCLWIVMAFVGGATLVGSLTAYLGLHLFA